MNKFNYRPAILLILLLIGVTACGPEPMKPGTSHADEHKEHRESAGDHENHAGHEDGESHQGHGGHGEEADEHGHGQEAKGASFEEGKGISLLSETKAAIGLETAPVETRPIRPVIRFSVQVYRSSKEGSRSFGPEKSGFAYATGLVPPHAAGKVRVGDAVTFAPGEGADAPHGGKVIRLDPTQQEIIGKVEVLMEMEDPDESLPVGAFLEAVIQTDRDSGSPATVPRSAVLKTAQGKFAYVQNGDSFLRVPISTGEVSDDYIEITDGLYEGDVVAVQPVEKLYLIELRAVKGGGHSH